MKYGLWEVIGEKTADGKVQCLCECGTQRLVLAANLLSGKSNSCGCVGRQKTKDRNAKHGYSSRSGSTADTYRRWANLIEKRGSEICSRWRLFDNFHLDMGDAPESGRIYRRNKDLPFDASNCFWGSRYPSLRHRFYEKIMKDHRGCWIWTANKCPFGYGKININKKQTQAHRISWMIHKGEIPDGLFVLHKCDVPSCVNPDHLFLGTHQDNMNDRARKGRTARGGKVYGKNRQERAAQRHTVSEVAR